MRACVRELGGGGRGGNRDCSIDARWDVRLSDLGTDKHDLASWFCLIDWARLTARAPLATALARTPALRAHIPSFSSVVGPGVVGFGVGVSQLQLNSPHSPRRPPRSTSRPPGTVMRKQEQARNRKQEQEQE